METTIDRMADIYDDAGRVLITRLGPRATERYNNALWYAWGRDDAGDKTLETLPRRHYLGNDFAFAEIAAVAAERFDRQITCSLANVGSQYAAFVESLR